MTELRPLSKRYTEDLNWAFGHYAELVTKHPNKWIAVANKKILGVAISSSKALAIARKKIKREQIPVLFIEKGMHVYTN